MRVQRSTEFRNSPRELGAWKRNQGVFLFSGNYAQVVLLDLGDPIATVILKPVRISRDCPPVITAVFALNDLEIKAKNTKKRPIKPYYIIAVYDRKAKAFCYHLKNPFELQYVLDSGDFKYVAGKERENIKRLLTIENGALATAGGKA